MSLMTAEKLQAIVEAALMIAGRPFGGAELGRRFAGMTGAAVVAASAGPEAEAEAAGVDWADEQIRGLVAAKVPGVHLYILNRASSALALFAKLKEQGVFGEE